MTSTVIEEVAETRPAASNSADAVWTRVCAYEQLVAERGVAALIGGVQIAIVRTHDGAVFALANQDPFSGAYVLSRGIVGNRGDVPTIASPMHKQVFDLRNGTCLDDPDVRVATFGVRVRDGDVEVAVQ
jgi:nitrite reductase (NADH) small subunit